LLAEDSLLTPIPLLLLLLLLLFMPLPLIDAAALMRRPLESFRGRGCVAVGGGAAASLGLMPRGNAAARLGVCSLSNAANSLWSAVSVNATEIGRCLKGSGLIATHKEVGSKFGPKRIKTRRCFPKKLKHDPSENKNIPK
jgi:hypothetical protein